jgi:CheY-like chemotaxis protein
MNMLAPSSLTRDHMFAGTMSNVRQGIVLIVSDDPETIEKLTPVCAFLDLKAEIVSADMNLTQVLNELRPMAVITDIECETQDGFHVMKLVARHSRDLPILVLTGGNPAMMGAADAMQDLCGLTSVTQSSGFTLAGQLVAFLFNAGRKAGCMRLVPV